MIKNRDNVSKPLVSVIINCYNGEKYLQKAIDSVYEQTYQNWEIVFWDNASTDRSADMAKSYDNRLKYFRSEETVPLGKARNWAVEKANGKYIAFLDCDDIWYIQKLEKQMKLFYTNPRLGLVYSDIYNCYNDGKKIPGSLFYNFYDGNAFKRLLKINFIAFSSVVLIKDLVGEFGGFPSYSIAEDYALLLQITNKHPIGFVDEPLVEYLHHEKNVSRNLEITLKEVEEIYNYWILEGDEDVKKICKKSMGNECYGLSRKALFHLNNKILARNYINASFKYQRKLKYFIFRGFIFLPIWLVKLIKKAVNTYNQIRA
jgi:glycosyltransferase involved in cell wall biosynthesis